jgi:ABC-type transport system substrate-binding protein
MKRTKQLLFVFVVLCLILPNAYSQKVDVKDTLKVAYYAYPSQLDPQKTTEFYAAALNCFDRLVEAETTGPSKSEIVPGLAEKWAISADGLVYTFTLRKGVKFQNGETFKADDVLYTFDRMLNPATKALNTDFMDMIAGAKDRMNGKADKVSGIKVINDQTIQITLAAPYAPFLANIATPAGSIFNRKATEAAGEKFGLEPDMTIGSGPFVYTENVVNDHFTFTAYKAYWRGAPALKGVTFKIIPDADTQRMMFETGELDLFDCDLARTQIPYFEGSARWKKQIVSAPKVATFYLHINESIKPFDDVRVRKAIQMAIDRKSILEKLYYGKGQLVHGILPPGLAGFNTKAEVIPYDMAKAKALLAEAGLANGFGMTIAQVSGNASILKIGEVIQSMLKPLGIDVKIDQMDEAAYYATRAEGKLPMYTNDWGADFNDPDNFIYTFFSSKNTVSRSFNYKNADVQAKLEKARSMTDPTARYALYRQLEKTIVIDDAAWLPLFALEHLFVVQPRVKGFKLGWNGASNMSYYGVTLAK